MAWPLPELRRDLRVECVAFSLSTVTRILILSLMNKTTNITKLEAALAELNAAEAAHAACFKFSYATMRVECVVSDDELKAAWDRVQKAGRAVKAAMKGAR